MLPRRPQDVPRRFQDTSRRAQDAPRRPQEAPRRPQDAPTCSHDAAKMPQDVPKTSFGSPSRTKMEPSWHQNPSKVSIYIETTKTKKNIEKTMKINDFCSSRGSNRIPNPWKVKLKTLLGEVWLPKMLPRRSQDASKTPQHAPKTAPRHSKTHTCSHKSRAERQDIQKDANMEPSWHQNRSQNAPKIDQKSIKNRCHLEVRLELHFQGGPGTKKTIKTNEKP